VPIRHFYDVHFNMAQEDYPALLREYAECCARRLPECALADGAIEVLERLQTAGVSQVILTSGEQGVVERALKHYGILQYFDAVLGASDYFAESKLKRAREYLQAQKIPPEQVLMTGDLAHDFFVARELGTRCVLVSRGHQGEVQFAGLEAEVISSLSYLSFEQNVPQLSLRAD
jgi:phosphoglycolate phosphatase